MNNSYENSRVAVDAVVFTIHEGKLKVLLHRREKKPFLDMMELPGGLFLENETAEETLRRKINDLLAINDVFLQQFFTFTEPKRDPRTRTVSIGFIALIDSKKIKDFSDWYDYSSIDKLAFDHNEIIKKARTYLKENINSIIIKQFMPKLFPLNSLQEAYEIIEEKKYDNRNFRKTMINSGLVSETRKLEEDVSHRPAVLYKFK